MPTNVDAVVLWVRFLGHSQQGNIAGRPGVYEHRGGLRQLVELLGKIVSNLAKKTAGGPK